MTTRSPLQTAAAASRFDDEDYMANPAFTGSILMPEIVLPLFPIDDDGETLRQLMDPAMTRAWNLQSFELEPHERETYTTRDFAEMPLMKELLHLRRWADADLEDDEQNHLGEEDDEDDIMPPLISMPPFSGTGRQ